MPWTPSTRSQRGWTRVRALLDATPSGHLCHQGFGPGDAAEHGVGRYPTVLQLDHVNLTLGYFILPDTTMGSMAEHTVIDVRRSIVLPEGGDPLSSPQL